VIEALQVCLTPGVVPGERSESSSLGLLVISKVMKKTKQTVRNNEETVKNKFFVKWPHP
jgi:hypothetical protein